MDIVMEQARDPLVLISEDEAISMFGEFAAAQYSHGAQTFVRQVVSIREHLKVFGLKNSHILRRALESLFERQSITCEAQLWIYLFCSLAKTKNRIVSGISRLPDDVKQFEAVVSARAFIVNHMVSWPNEETDNRFATVHVASTNPGLSTMLWSLAHAEPEISAPLDELYQLTWFPQLKLHANILDAVKRRQTTYWTEVVKKSRAGNVPPGFKEDIWANQLADDYKLATLIWEGPNLRIRYVQPTNVAAGYDELDILTWWAELMYAIFSMPPEVAGGQPPAGPGGGPGGAFPPPPPEAPRRGDGDVDGDDGQGGGAIGGAGAGAAQVGAGNQLPPGLGLPIVPGGGAPGAGQEQGLPVQGQQLPLAGGAEHPDDDLNLSRESTGSNRSDSSSKRSMTDPPTPSKLLKSSDPSKVVLRPQSPFIRPNPINNLKAKLNSAAGSK